MGIPSLETIQLNLIIIGQFMQAQTSKATTGTSGSLRERLFNIPSSHCTVSELLVISEREHQPADTVARKGSQSFAASERNQGGRGGIVQTQP